MLVPRLAQLRLQASAAGKRQGLCGLCVCVCEGVACVHMMMMMMMLTMMMMMSMMTSLSKYVGSRLCFQFICW